MVTQFRDRRDAGIALSQELGAYANRQDVIVLGLPRGGVPVAFEVARALKAPLDVFPVRKLGVPGHEELAMGAIAPGDALYLENRTIQMLGIPDDVVRRVIATEREELDRRRRAYRGDRPPPEVRDRVAILVDDGLATGATMRAAVEALRSLGPASVVIAVPTASPQTCAEFEPLVDDIICAITPDPFYAVGVWYENFSQTTDEEVRDLLAQAEAWRARR